jgi:ABC-2 type transport system permease protein
MSTVTHIRYELLRTVRNRRMLAFSLGLPLVLFYAVGSAQRHAHTDGIAFPLYFMVGMAVYGALFAAVGPGARIALDRSRGWTRQLRITPLSVRVTFLGRVLTAYIVALPSLIVLYLAGASLGVHLSVGQYLELTGWLLLGLAPIVLIGIILGHLLTSDALAPAVGGVVVFFALFGGALGRFFNGGVMSTLVRLLPSYWMVDAGHDAVHGGGWPAEAWIVITAWIVILVPLAALVYRRDTRRV